MLVDGSRLVELPRKVWRPGRSFEYFALFSLRVSPSVSQPYSIDSFRSFVRWSSRSRREGSEGPEGPGGREAPESCRCGREAVLGARKFAQRRGAIISRGVPQIASSAGCIGRRNACGPSRPVARGYVDKGMYARLLRRKWDDENVVGGCAGCRGGKEEPRRRFCHKPVLCCDPTTPTRRDDLACVR